MLALARQMKSFTGKKQKTDSDYQAIADLEWVAGWYYESDLVEVAMQGEDLIIGDHGALIMPSRVLFAVFWAGAKQYKLGQKFKQGCFFIHDGNFDFQGKGTLEEMLRNPNLRVQTLETVNKAKVVRTRPMFQGWSVKFSFHFDDSVLDNRQITMIMDTAGRLIGIGERRPSWGRFESKIHSITPMQV